MQNTAFTLIELLVVIAIIGILASIGIATYGDALARGRDSQRISDIKELKTSLARYFVENNKYPVCDSAVSGNEWCGSCDTAGQTEFETALQPLVTEGYIEAIPQDPRNEGPCYTFEYYTNNQSSTMQCGGEDISNFGYAIRFGTEAAELDGFKEFSQQRVDGTEYCIVGERI